MKTIDKSKDEAPHFVESENCMGQTARYWRQFLFCSNGECVCGTGMTSEQASSEANKNRDEREKFINADPREKIKQLLSNGKDCRGTKEQNDFNLAVAQILGIL